jgi:hypothetical protein
VTLDPCGVFGSGQRETVSQRGFISSALRLRRP